MKDLQPLLNDLIQAQREHQAARKVIDDASMAKAQAEQAHNVAREKVAEAEAKLNATIREELAKEAPVKAAQGGRP